MKQPLFLHMTSENNILYNGKNVRDENLIEGVISGNEKGFAFLLNNDGDYYVSKYDLKGAINGDTVLCKEVKSSGHSRQAEVVKIISRGNESIVGTFEKVKSGGFVIPDNRKISTDIFIPFEKCGKAKTGDKVECKILFYPKNRSPEGEIKEIIGRQFDTQTEIKCILKSHSIDLEFPKPVVNESKLINKEVKIDEIINRKDFRFKQVITIDGEDARDFDDAISIEKDNDNYVLGVHIADVSHYVIQGTEIDKEAFNRSTSVYLPELVIPMLPKVLSNNVCSLVEGKDRLTLSCVMKINSEGDVLESEVVESVINSSARMTYSNVSKILDGDEKLSQKYQDFLPMIFLMKELCEILIKKRTLRGSIDLDVKESKIFVNKFNEICITEADRTFSNKIIEEFMILANETIAEKYFYCDVPFIYRVHEKPKSEKLESFSQFINELGFTHKWKKETVHSKDFAKILDSFKDSTLFFLVNRVMLRSMQKAKYSPDDVGHFGLSSNHYCHFTSPIRRDPDLVIHRIIKSIIHGEIESVGEKFGDFVYEASSRSSIKERSAQEAERDVDDYYKMLYISNKIGEEFDAIISGVTNFGVFVELPNTIEGLVKLETLGGGKYEFDEKRYVLKNKKYEYRLGGTVKVIAVGIDFSAKRPEFIIKDNFYKGKRRR